MNTETFPSSSCTPADCQTLNEDKEKTSCEVSGVQTSSSSSSPQDPVDADVARSSQASSRSRRRRRRNKCLEQFKKMSKSMTLENSGSVARDHLASERTFLAYVRTSIGCSTMGVGTSRKVISLCFACLIWVTLPSTALVQLFSLTTTNSTPKIRRVGNVLGAIVVMIGMAVLIMGKLGSHAV